MSFTFLGKGPLSKSLLLRALIVQSYFPQLHITGDSECDDVSACKKGLQSLKNKTEINCLSSAAVLRFLSLRVARESGSFVLKGTPQLFSRPIKELQVILNQLNCDIKFKKTSIELDSSGWNLLGDSLVISAQKSSQFASAIFLNSWNLDYDLFINIEGEIISSSYLQMSILFLRSLGMQITHSDSEYFIPAKQKITSFVYNPEPDMSCLFALAAMTIVQGEVFFTDWPTSSLQPDFIFPDILQQMNFQIQYKKQTLKISGGQKLNPIKYNIKNCCDLFPVLSALCALAKGTSRLYGAPHLIYKESNRIKQVAQLLIKIGRTVKVLEDGLIIEGKDFSKKELSSSIIYFDPQKDHRMVMMAAVLKQAGIPIHILYPQVVNKSFPDFLSITGI